MTRTLSVWVMTALLALATLRCSHEPQREPVAPTLVDEDDEAPEKASFILRSNYEAVVSGSMQTVIAWFFLRPHYQQGRFVGYEVAEIYNQELTQGPLRVGDVILEVNDSSVEKPEQAMAVWRGLWGRKDLRLKLLRKGKVVQYQIPIVDALPEEQAP